MTTINDLPPEILVHIFSYVLESETQENFVKNVAKVCRMWEEASKDASLWRYFDGTLSFQILKNYSKKGYLRQTKELVFSSLKKIPFKKNDHDKINNFKLEITKIYENMQELKCINFSNAIKFLETGIGNVLIESSSCCIGLQKMIVNDKNLGYYPTFSHRLFKNFIEFHGPKLVSLDFSNILLKIAKELFLNIASSCPNLEELIVQNLNEHSSSPIFPVEVVQNGLPKLKVLRLGYIIIFKQKQSVKSKGFPNLEVFTYPSNSSYHFIDAHFKKILMKSPNLKVLDIRGTDISCAAVSSLPASNVERLYVSHTKLYDSPDFIDVLIKWGHSLTVLDISRTKNHHINDNFQSLLKAGSLQNLENLDVNNTSIAIPTVKLLIQNCDQLKFLQLESCRSFGRGLKRPYHGKKALDDLLSKLDDVMEID